jgi:hypothetical protein
VEALVDPTTKAAELRRISERPQLTRERVARIAASRMASHQPPARRRALCRLVHSLTGEGVFHPRDACYAPTMSLRLSLFVLALMVVPVAHVASAQEAPSPATEAQPAPAAAGEAAAPPSEAAAATAPAAVEAQPSATATLDTPNRPAAPAGSDPRTRAILVEYLRVDDELVAVEARRREHRLGAPLSLMIVGSAVSAVFGIVTLIHAAHVRDLESDLDRDYDYGGTDSEEVEDARRVKNAMLGVSLVGLSVGVGCAVWFFRNLRVRRPLDASRVDLRVRRDALKLQLKLQLSGGEFAAGVAAPF